MRVRALLLLLIPLGCNGYVPAPRQTVKLPSPLLQVYEQLRTTDGPSRFAQVDDHLYRGAQPTAAQVRQLYALGVRTIVCLRGSESVEEEAAARALGMRFEKLGFSAFSIPNEPTLRRIVEQIQASPDPVYVHCAQGRDRTSLVVALYRVWVSNWAPGQAWEREARDFGHGAIWFAGLDHAFASVTRAPPSP